MNYNIALLPGDGIGPEVIDETVKVLSAIENTFNHKFNYIETLIGAIAIDKENNPLPKKTLEVCNSSDAILFGAIGDPKYDNNPSLKIRPEQGLLNLRKELGLFANIRPIKSYPSLVKKSPLKKSIILNTNFIIYRELTGGIYFGEKKISEDGKTASDLCEYSEFEIERIARLAFKSAQKRKKKLTLVDKANVLESSRLWRKVVTKISKDYSNVELNFLFVDNAAMQIILNPSQFDVILTENMFGDIISDEASVISGSIGLLASGSIGEKFALFEPIHGSYPQAKGKGIANPIACILSASLMLTHLNLIDESKCVENAVKRCIKNGILTPDLQQQKIYNTKNVGDYIKSIILKN